jgi:outer membrane lipoprotein-sorting protein
MGGRRRIALAGLTASALLAQSPEALLAKVDRLRHPWPSFSVEVTLEDGKVSQRWRVLARADGDARVEGVSEKEKGRTVLLLGEQMWLLLPHAKRPVKVTPQQRLLGPAAGGDIARSRFAEDYAIAGSANEDIEGRPATRLDLTARRPSISYRTAKLWISAEGTPLRAEFALLSGKTAKSVRFDASGSAQGARVLKAMTVEDPGGAKTRIAFDRWTPMQPDPDLFRLPETK